MMTTLATAAAVFKACVSGTSVAPEIPAILPRSPVRNGKSGDQYPCTKCDQSPRPNA